MGWFGGREQQEARSRIQTLEAELEKVGRELEQARSRRAEADRERDRLKQELDAARKQAADAVEAAGKARSSLAKAEQMVAWLEQKRAEAAGALEEAARARDEALAAARESGREAEELRARLEGLQGELDRLRLDRAAREAAPTPEPDPRPRRQEAPARPSDPEERARWSAQVDDLKRRLAETEERLRVALRKAEHNRRAWLVTQSQLDLAEDRICLLTTGKPRPVLREPPPASDGPMVAEEVEEDPDSQSPGEGEGGVAGSPDQD
ncbi:hypothetical protein KBD49_12255 [Myxococcota bacterium]|nr:hypothetical protein [Myxococcota bacterium]